jgi:hypothetical protein
MTPVKCLGRYHSCMTKLPSSQLRRSVCRILQFALLYFGLTRLICLIPVQPRGLIPVKGRGEMMTYFL